MPAIGALSRRFCQNRWTDEQQGALAGARWRSDIRRLRCSSLTESGGSSHESGLQISWRESSPVFTSSPGRPLNARNLIREFERHLRSRIASGSALL